MINDRPLATRKSAAEHARKKAALIEDFVNNTLKDEDNFASWVVHDIYDIWNRRGWDATAMEEAIKKSLRRREGR